jgi:hypothetical protein
MPNRDGKSALQVVHLGNLTLSGTTPANSDLVDMRDFDKATFLVVANTVTDAGTAAGFATEVQEGDTTAGAGFTAVADAELSDLESTLTVTSDSADNTIAGGIGYVGNSRYARLVLTGTTGTDADVSVLCILSKAHAQPPTFVGAAVSAT